MYRNLNHMSSAISTDQDKTRQSQDNIDGEWKWSNGLAGYGFEKSSFGIRVRD
jgi:hypothetical protein